MIGDSFNWLLKALSHAFIADARPGGACEINLVAFGVRFVHLTFRKTHRHVRSFLRRAVERHLARRGAEGFELPPFPAQTGKQRVAHAWARPLASGTAGAASRRARLNLPRPRPMGDKTNGALLIDPLLLAAAPPPGPVSPTPDQPSRAPAPMQQSQSVAFFAPVQKKNSRRQ